MHDLGRNRLELSGTNIVEARAPITCQTLKVIDTGVVEFGKNTDSFT